MELAPSEMGKNPEKSCLSVQQNWVEVWFLEIRHSHHASKYKVKKKFHHTVVNINAQHTYKHYMYNLYINIVTHIDAHWYINAVVCISAHSYI